MGHGMPCREAGGPDTVKLGSRSSNERLSPRQSPSEPAKSPYDCRGTEFAPVADVAGACVEVGAEQRPGPLAGQTQVMPIPSAVASKKTAADITTTARS